MNVTCAAGFHYSTDQSDVGVCSVYARRKEAAFSRCC